MHLEQLYLMALILMPIENVQWPLSIFSSFAKLRLDCDESSDAGDLFARLFCSFVLPN